jgi:hypothetical protein
MGQNDADLFETARKLNVSAQQNVDEMVVLPAGALVGEAVAPWGESTGLILASSLTAVGWKDEAQNTAIEIALLGDKASIVPARRVVGVARTDNGEADIVAEKAVAGPSFWWKVTHPF